MAVSARLKLFAETGYGDQDKDANAQLVELDNALRSARVGDQCEAIVRFPRLFEKYPFPILINSAFLKLADVFRRGSNFLRLCVLKVTQQSEKHLDKITNIDEVVKRIFTVIHSNDPVARAITIRTLGSLATVIAERKNVHHSITNALHSHDSVELEAAIFAIDRFSAQSRTFASSVCNQLADTIEGLATPVDTKMKLIPIFQHMYHDPTTCKRARELCVQLLPSYPGRGAVLVTLHTLSQLAARSLVDMPQQVVLLLDYVQKDPRRAVKIAALQDLRLLAARGPHMWTSENIKGLCNFAKEASFDVFMLGSLHVLTTLSSSIAISSFSTQDDSPEMDMCTTCCYHSNIHIAAKATELLTHLALHKYKVSAEGGQELIEDAAMALESLMVVTTSNPSQKNRAALKVVLQCVVQLCRVCPSVSDRFMDMATTAVNARADASVVLVCECLASIGSHCNELLPSLTEDLLKALDHAIQTRTSSMDQLVVSLSTILLQSCVGDPIPDHIKAGVCAALEVTNQWTVYRVARQAARYGHHHIAAQLFESLTSKVSTEHFHFWLSALRDCCLAETCLQRPVITTADYMTNISDAETYYHKAIASIKAATTPMSLLSFQCQYLQLRTQMLQAQAQLVRVCCSFQTSPPPAIASSLAITTGKEIHRCGHIVTQLQKCCQQFGALCTMYGNLYQSSFDADPATLVNLQILQQSCELMIHVLESLLRSTPESDVGPKVAPPMSGSFVEHQPWLNACEEVIKKLQETNSVNVLDLGPGDIRPPTAAHMEMMQTASMLLTSVPLCFPRYFFQILQATSIKLAISPQPRSPNDPITIHYDSLLAVKVEGVIQHGVHPGLFRKVSEIQLSLSSAQQSRSQMMADVKLRENPTNEMHKTTEPHNDYFSTQFLLTFPIAGIHQVSIEASVIDENGIQWKTGPKASLTVKSYDEAVQRQQQQQYAAQRQQQRAAMSTSSY